MNIRNFKPNNIKKSNRNRMPMNFNVLGNAGQLDTMRNMPPINNDFPGQLPVAQKWGLMPQFAQQQRQSNNESMFLREPGRGMQNGPPRPLLHAPNNCLPMPIGEPLFNQGPFNRGGLEATPAAQSGVELFYGTADRGWGSQLNRNPDKGPGFQFNRSPNRGPGFHLNHSPGRGRGFPLNNKNQERARGFQLNNSLEPSLPPGPPNRSPNRGPGFQFNRSPERDRAFQLNLSLERTTGQVQGPPNRSPERSLDFYQRQLSRSPARGSRGHRSRSPLNPSRQNSLGRDSRRDSPPYRQRQSPVPGIGPLRLCGSRMKWYIRYKRKGFSHDEALCMAKEPTQPADNYKLALEAPMGEPMPSRDNLSDDEFIQNNERSEPMNEGERIGDPNELTVCLVPIGYPRESLTQQEKLDLEEAILQEVVMAGPQSGAPLRFSNIHFKPGFLKVDCANQVAADWLLRVGSRLYSYNGRPVEAALDSVKVPGQNIFISVFLPRGACKSDDFLLSLLKSQNQYNTYLWKLDCRKNQGGGALLVLGIDKESAADIAANDNLIFYRYGTVPVRGLKRYGYKPPPKSAKPLSNRAPRNPVSVKLLSPISKRGPRNSSRAQPSSPISERGLRNTSRAKSSTPISKRGSKQTTSAKQSTPIASRSPKKTPNPKHSTTIASRSPQKAPNAKPSTPKEEEKPKPSSVPKVEPVENPQISQICIDLASDDEDNYPNPEAICNISIGGMNCAESVPL